MKRLDQYRENLREQIEARLVPIEGGPLDGIEMASRDSIREAFEAAEQPDADDHEAEMVTPATVYVDAVCDLCRQRVALTVTLATETKSVNGRQHIKVVGKTTGAAHVCGQVALKKVGDEAEGQTEAWDLTDIVGDLPPSERTIEDDDGDAGEAEHDPTVCPHPGCTRPVDHRGKHSPKVKPTPGEGDDGPDPGTQSADGDPEGSGDPAGEGAEDESDLLPE